MTDLRILDDIAQVPTGSGCALIIRHGDRDGVMDRVVADEKGLNDRGSRRSLELGRSLRRFTELRSWSSPIGRCVDTCAKVGEGFGSSCPIESTEFLGMRAPFMRRPEEAYRLMKTLGLNGFVKAYVSDEIDPQTALPCPEGTRMLLSYAIERTKGMREGVGLFVTHDMIITPPLAYYFGYDYEGKGLVPFLDGVVLYETKGGYAARFRGEVLKVAPDGRAEAPGGL